jgi:transposase
LDWASECAVAKGFSGATVACEPTGHRWRVLGQLATDRSMPFVCVQPIQTSWARRSEDLTFDKTDDKDAVLIARLTAQLRCYVPEPVDETWGRLRHLGARRERLIVEAGAQVRQIRDLLECVWPAALEAANWPFRSKTWAATLWVILDRDSGDFTRTRRLGLARFETAVRREITKRGGQKPCLRIARKLFTALADPTGVLAHRRGALERVQLLLEDWADTQRKLADTESRMTAVLDELQLTELATSIHGPSPVGARGSWPRPATQPGSPPPGRWSSTPAWHRRRRSPAPSLAAPNSPAKADRNCDSRPGARSGARCRPTPSTPPATDTSPPVRPTSSLRPRPRASSPRRSCDTSTR